MLARLLLGALSLLPAVNAVWPVPKEISTGDQVLFIEKNLEITYNGEPVRWTTPDIACPDTLVDAEILNPQLAYPHNYEPASGSSCNDKDVVQGGISRAMTAIFEHGFVPWKLRPAHEPFEPDLDGGKGSVTSLTINHSSDSDGTCYKPLAGAIDESYSLELTEDGAATIEAETSIGVLRGLETFVQLFYKHSSEGCWYTEVAPVSIKDEPKFPHRGLLLDVARTWYPIEDLRRTIDALSWNKMNRFHIHMTDSQSWPIEIPSIPGLAEHGSYRKGLTYSPEDVASLQRYGSDRGVEVIVEIDMPTHLGRGVVDTRPDLIIAYDARPYSDYCAQPPCGMFKLSNTDVHDFVRELFSDLLPRLSPYTSYFHTGGDELNPNSMTLDDGVESNDPDVIRPLLQDFIDVAHTAVREAGLTPMVWEEMTNEWGLDLGEDVVVQCWLGSECMKNVTSKGFKAFDSNSEAWVRNPIPILLLIPCGVSQPFSLRTRFGKRSMFANPRGKQYLSCGAGQWLDFANGPIYQQYYPFNDWCGPYKNWKLVYSHDPVAGLSEEQAKNVLGGEVAIWSETLDPMELDTKAWPRAGVAGEVLWSGRQDASGQNRSLIEAGVRLADMRERMVARGVRVEQLTQLWCLQDEDPEACEQMV